MDIICMILGIAAVIVAAAALIREEDLRRKLKEAEDLLAAFRQELDGLSPDDYYEEDVEDTDITEDDLSEYSAGSDITDDTDKADDAEASETKTDDISGADADIYGYDEPAETEYLDIAEEPDEAEGFDEAEDTDDLDENEGFDEADEVEGFDEAEDTDDLDENEQFDEADEVEGFYESEDDEDVDDPNEAENTDIPEGSGEADADENNSDETLPDDELQSDPDFDAQVDLITQELERQEQAENNEADGSDDANDSETSDPEDDELEKKYFSSYSAFAAESEAAAPANESGVVSMEAGSREASVSVGDKMYDGVPVGESELDYVVNVLKLNLDTEPFMSDTASADEQAAEETETAPVSDETGDTDLQVVPVAVPESSYVKINTDNIVHFTGDEGSWLGTSMNHRSVVRRMTVSGAPFVMDECIFAGFRGYNTAEITFRNISKKNITSLVCDVICEDARGTEIDGVNGYRYSDLDVKTDDRFGFGTVIDLPGGPVAGITPVVRSVTFDDGSVWESDDADWYPCKV